MPSKIKKKTAKLDSSSAKQSKIDTITSSTEVKDEETPDVPEVSITSDKENITESPVANNDKEAEESSDDDDASDSEEEESSSDDDELFAGLSKEEIAKLKAAMSQTQQGYNEQMEQEQVRQIKQTKETIEFNLQIQVSDEEAQFIAEFVENNNQNLENELQDDGVYFLQSMKEMMEQRKQLSEATNNDENEYDDELDEYEHDDDEDEDWVMNEKKKKAKRAQKRKQNGSKNTNLDGTKRCGRLLLNDALKNAESMDGWSEARKKAWKNRKTSPNAYFYRFNVPGQAQKNGKWKLNEHALFMKRVRDFGVNDQWGLFSKAIPGRVGYQCSNYWRGLVKEKDVTDPNYHYDGKKLHFKRNTKQFAISSEYRKYAITINKDKSKIWTNLPTKHPKHPSVEYCEKVKEALRDSGAGNNKKRKNEDWNEQPTKKKRRRNRKKNKWDDDDDVEYTIKTKKNDASETETNDNPMPDFVDIMTGVEVVKPAISPYGHVLGYDTWTKILRTSKHKNLCPFTLQKLTRRSLIKLTKDNYDDYKDKITNITKEQTDLLASINK